MADTVTLTATFEYVEPDEGGNNGFGTVVLYQEGWDESATRRKSIGTVTKLDIVKALEAQLFDGEPPNIDCGVMVTPEGVTQYECVVTAESSDYDLPLPEFKIGITNGSIGNKIISDDGASFAFTVTVPAREEATLNVFQSCVYAWWNGGVTLLVLDPPPNAEENYYEERDCTGVSTGGGSTTINDDEEEEEDKEPKAKAVDKTINLNYCRDFGHE